MLLVNKTCQIPTTFPISATLTTFIFVEGVVGFSQCGYQHYFTVGIITLHNTLWSTACTCNPLLHMVCHFTGIMNYQYKLLHYWIHFSVLVYMPWLGSLYSS